MASERSDYPNLFSPLSIRGVKLRNRLVFQPHFTVLGTRDGMPTEDHVAYHEARAEGGVGLIVFESQAVHPSGQMSRRYIRAWDPEVLPVYRRITDAVHSHGARIFGQLTHGGHTSLENPPHILWAPTQMPEPSTNFSTKAMDESDIRATIHSFATAARHAYEGGFDGVEIKVAHDGLLRSFASPFFNRRTDSYGGSFENRMRLPIEVAQAIKEATSDDFPVGVRICLHEYTPWGYELDYGLKMAGALEQSGAVDYFNCDAGSFSSFWMEIPPFPIPQGFFNPLNMELKKASDLPVVAFGRIKRPEMAEAILSRGEADLMGMARQLIADPDTPNKMREGRVDEIRYCIAIQEGCIGQVAQDQPVRCVHNPAAGRERYLSEAELMPAREARSVVVVGGGPAGLKVAETAARRGHRVTLCERSNALGGQFRLVARQPLHEEFIEVVSYLEQAMKRLGVNVRLNERVDGARLAQLDADVIVIATGSRPNVPWTARRAAAEEDGAVLARQLGRQPDDVVLHRSISGLDGENVFSSDEILSGAELPGKRVLVVDAIGTWEAVGTAEYLADAGCRVQVITDREVAGSDLDGSNRTLFYQRAGQKGITLTPFTDLMDITASAARIRNALTNEENWVQIDAVVPVYGRRSREDLYLQLTAREGSPLRSGTRVERVGDCVAPRLLRSNISEAYLLGRDI